MDTDRFKSFKYMLGQPTFKKGFEGIQIPDGNIEGNYITSNGKFVAVSEKLCLYSSYSFHGKAQEEWLLYIRLRTSINVT
jgi:hypothetical protein